MVVARGVADYRPDAGHGDNGEAEWLALIHACEAARNLGATDIILLGDSAMVVAQASGVATCRRGALRRHHATFSALCGHFARVRIRHISRHQNLAGIALDRLRG